MTKNKFVTSLAKCSPHIFISSCTMRHGSCGCGLCPFFNIFEGSWLRFSVSSCNRQNPITYTQSHTSKDILSNKMYWFSYNKFWIFNIFVFLQRITYICNTLLVSTLLRELLYCWILLNVCYFLLQQTCEQVVLKISNVLCSKLWKYTVVV